MLTTIKQILTMPGRFIEACQTLALRTPHENTQAQTLAAIAKSLAYLENSERRKLLRAGQPHEF